MDRSLAELVKDDKQAFFFQKKWQTLRCILLKRGKERRQTRGNKHLSMHSRHSQTGRGTYSARIGAFQRPRGPASMGIGNPEYFLKPDAKRTAASNQNIGEQPGMNWIWTLVFAAAIVVALGMAAFRKLRAACMGRRLV